MRQFAAVLFAGGLVLGLLGCGSDANKKPTKSASCSNCPDGTKCGDGEKCGTAKKCEKCPEGKCICAKPATADPAAEPGGCCPGH